MAESHEILIPRRSGWTMLARNLGLLAGGFVMTIVVVGIAGETNNDFVGLGALVTVPSAIAGFVMLFGHYTLQPNQARVLLLFGEYRGTVRDTGFGWVNPFYSKRTVSLRTRNFDGDKLKVNDKRGSPIDISAVVVWRVTDTAKAVFDVEDYQEYVRVQSDSALRNLAGDFAYDGDDLEDEVTLRDGKDEVSLSLQKHLQVSLGKAGVTVDEARLNHLAYSTEIAGAMLRRQQAEAVIAARTKIVHGAVSMVEMALAELDQKHILNLDDERKAAMVSNLLVVLCSESEAQPVVNTGTLYT